MFALVKFFCDGEKQKVPVKFIKDFELPIDNGRKYWVFWSNNPNDTPQSILEEQGVVLHVDQEKEIKNKGKSPLPGYYLARILTTAETENDLENELETKKGRRNLCKVDESCDSAKKKSIKEKPKPHELFKLARKNTLEKFKKKSVHSSESDECESKNEKELSTLRKEIEYQKQRYSKLSIKYKDVVELNLEYQKRFLAVAVLKDSDKDKVELPAGTSKMAPVVTASVNFLSEDKDKVELPAGTSKMAPVVTASVNFSSEDKDTVELFLGTRKIVPLSTATVNDLSEDRDNVELFLETQKIVPYSSEDFFLSDTKIALALYKVKPGVAGDSLYVKNLAVMIFSTDVLAVSSVTGSKCNAKKETVAKPQLCLKKMDYLKLLFCQRLHKEDPAPTELIVLQRCKKINSVIADKIASITRYRKAE